MRSQWGEGCGISAEALSQHGDTLLKPQHAEAEAGLSSPRKAHEHQCRFSDPHRKRAGERYPGTTAYWTLLRATPGTHWGNPPTWNWIFTSERLT